ncbi:MAG: hypothetical protein ACR2OG_05850 [Gemmatimonadaceae bacterium]
MRPRPIFESPAAERANLGRLLLIAYNFPPDQEIGALRWQKLARHAAERGWMVDVVTRDPAELESRDETRLADLPAGTRIYGVPFRPLLIERLEVAVWRALRPHLRGRAREAATRGAASVTRKGISWRDRPWKHLLRANHVLLHYGAFHRWARHAADLAVRLYEPGLHRAVISTGPPHMAHESGRRVAHATQVPFIMDMRDPWSMSHRLGEQMASPIWFTLAEYFQDRAVAQAALIVANTESLRLLLLHRYPEAQERLITVMNGSDEELLPQSQLRERFVAAFAGDIYIDRDPRPLFRGAARAVRDLDLSPEQFGISLLGTVEQYAGASVRDIAREEGIDAFVTLLPRRTRGQALEFLAGAAMLVSLPQDSDMTIPSKIFEYAQFNAWLLALARPDSATELVLRGSGADVIDPDDVEGLAAILKQRYQQFRSGVRPTAIGADGRFSRRVQAQRLLDAIHRCCTGLAPLSTAPAIPSGGRDAGPAKSSTIRR